jgi:IS4 transposase
MLVQMEFDFVEDKVGKYWDCCTLVTNDEELDAATLQQVYRDRGDCENNFDEYKNQYGWGG